jgi:hypothetical protein
MSVCKIRLNSVTIAQHRLSLLLYLRYHAGVPHQYELKELLALVPRNPSPTNSDAASRIAHASLSEGSDQQGSTAGQKAISTVSTPAGHAAR